MAMKKKAPAKKAAPKKNNDLSGVGSNSNMGRTAKRGIDQTNRNLSGERTQVLYNQIKASQSNKGDMGKERTEKRFKDRSNKVQKKSDTKQMVKSAIAKKRTERKGG